MSLEALVASISGAASIAGARWALRRTIRYCEEQCEKRMNAFREGLEKGKEQ